MILIDPRPASVDVEPTVVSLGQVGATDAQVRAANRKTKRATPKPDKKEASDGSQS